MPKRRHERLPRAAADARFFLKDLAEHWKYILTQTGYLKAVRLNIFGPVFLGFGPKIDPGTPQIAGACPECQFAPKISPGDQL